MSTPEATAATQSNWNLPNALTTLRIVMVPFFAVALLTDDGQSVLWRLVAWVLFLSAMFTDKIDGDIARSRGLVTNFGKIADPIADKALTGAAFIGLAVIGELWWWVAVVVLAREVGITAMRFWVIKHDVIAASRGGKLKTVVQTLALGLFILPLRGHGGLWGTVGEVVWYAAAVVMAVAVVLTVATGVEYVRNALADGRTRRGSTTAS